MESGRQAGRQAMPLFEIELFVNSSHNKSKKTSPDFWECMSTDKVVYKDYTPFGRGSDVLLASKHKRVKREEAKSG
jgi:hypothetical protein